MRRKNIIVPSTDTDVATIKLGPEHKEKIDIMIQRILENEKTSLMEKMKFIISKDESVTDLARKYIKKNILHIPIE